MATFQFTCPHCSHTMELPDTLLGKQGNCSACREVVLVTKTNCPEQVLLSRKDTKSRVVELEGLLADVLFGEDSPAKSAATLNQIWEEQRQLNDRMDTTQSILDRLEAVVPEVENRQNEHLNATKQLKRANTDIELLEKELGQSAMQAVMAGNIARSEIFEERIALYQRLAALESEKLEIGESANADWKDQLKSKSQYVKVTAQIKVEALKVGGLDKAIGRTLLSEGIEETMRCSETSAVLDRVCIKRIEQKAAVEVETAARIGFSDILQTASAIAKASPFESTASVQSEIKGLKRQLNEISKLLTKNSSVMLESAQNDETVMNDAAVGPELTELLDLKTRLEETKPGIRDIAKIAGTGWGQISRRTKSVGVAITLSLLVIVWISANQEDVAQIEIAASSTNSAEDTDSQAADSPPTPESSLSPSAHQGATVLQTTPDGFGFSKQLPPLKSSSDEPAPPLSDLGMEGSQSLPPDPFIEADRIAVAKREAEKVAAAKREAEKVAAAKQLVDLKAAAAKREAARIASEMRRNTSLTDFDKRARDFTVTLKPRGGRMTLGMGVADFRNEFPGVALKEPTNPDIPKNAGVWFFVVTPTHLEYEEVQGSFVNGRLFQLRKTYGAGNFARNDPDAFGLASGDVKKGLLQLIEDIGDAYGMTSVTKTTTTANNESVIHREFPLVHIHMEVQLDKRGKIHVSARKLDIRISETKPKTKTASANDNLRNVGSDPKSDVDSVKSDARLVKRDATKVLTLEGHSEIVRGVAFRTDGKHIVSGGDDATVKIWDAETGKSILTLRGHSGWVMCVSFSPDGKRIVSGSDDGIVKIWNAETGKSILTLKGHSDNVNSVVYSPDGKRIVSGSCDATVKIWDAETGKSILTLRGHSGWVLCVSFSPDGKRIVSGSYDNTIKIWDAETGQETIALKGHLDSVGSVAFSPDGKRIVSGSMDNTIKTWDANHGELQHTLDGHSGDVRSVAFSPDGKQIVSSSADKTLKVWDAYTGRVLLALEGHPDWDMGVSISPDVKHFVNGSRDGTLKVWGVAAAKQETARVVAAKRETVIVTAVKMEAARSPIAKASVPPRSIKTPKYIAFQKDRYQAMANGEISVTQYGFEIRRAHARLKLEGETPGEYYRRQLMFLLDHGTPQEKIDTASLVNAIEKAKQRGLSFVSPDMRREVSEWLPLVTQE